MENDAANKTSGATVATHREKSDRTMAEHDSA